MKPARAMPSPDQVPLQLEPQRAMHPAVLVVGVLALLMVLTVTGALWQLRRDTLGAQSRNLATLASALADELERGLQGVTVALQATRDDVREGRIVPGAPEAASLLHARAAILPMARKFWVLDNAGREVASSDLSPTPPIASFNPLPAGLADDAVALSAPYVDLAAHYEAVALAMRYVDPQGQRAGWVLAQVSAEALKGAFSKASPTPDARLLILRSDGLPLAGYLGRTPDDPAPRFDTAVEDAEGLLAFDDGSKRMVEVRNLERVAMRLILTRDADAGLRRWRQLAQISAGSLAIVFALLTAMLLRMQRAERARRQSQQALLEGQARIARAFAAAKEGSWEWDPQNGAIDLSPRMKELMGLARDAALDGATLDCLGGSAHPQDLPALVEALARQGQEGAPATGLDLVLRVRHADGRWHWIRWRGTASGDGTPGSRRVAGVAFDVTEEREQAAHTRRLEAELARSRQLESLGNLAGGVAHDFNNILAAVVGYGEMARQGAADGSAQARHIDQVLQAAARGKSVVERILSFSRGGARVHAAFAVQPVVQQVLDLLAATMDTRVKLERQLGDEPLWVHGDATQLFEATMNLCTNALQAMPAGGTLSVAVQARELAQETWLSHGRVAPGRHVELVVADTGEGILPRAMDHLFEPFFTTRGTGGTGLGLAVVHGVVEDFGGAIDVKSAPGEGSRFMLCFPRVEPKAEAEPKATAGAHDPLRDAAEVPADLPLGCGQTLLLVDDERTLVELAEEMLAELGYEPIGFSDPQAALAAFEAEPQRFDLVVTDEVMPGMVGTELARRLRAARPELPILLVSGWGGPQLAERAREAGIARVLAKPLQREALARAIAQALADAQASPREAMPRSQPST